MSDDVPDQTSDGAPQESAIQEPHPGSAATASAPNPLPPGEEPPKESLTGLHPGSYVQEPSDAPPTEGSQKPSFDTGLKYPAPASPFDPSNPVVDPTYAPDPKQPGGIRAPLTVDEAIEAGEVRPREVQTENPPAEAPSEYHPTE